jgi:hypothetical protein
LANFKLPQNGADIGTFYPPKDRTLTLVQWGGDPDGTRLELRLAPNDGQVWIWVSPKKMPEASQAFTLTNKVAYKELSLYGLIPGTSTHYTQPLKLIAGVPHPHPGYSVDLLAGLAERGSEAEVHLYTRVFEAPAPLLQQDTAVGKYNCGDVAASYAKTIFPGGVNLPYFSYYLPTPSGLQADLRFDPSRLQAAIGRIKGLLSRGIAVRVWVVYGDGFGETITTHDHVHFVTIFAYGANRFLFIDPWPGGSKFVYDGGIHKPLDNGFIGEFTFNAADLTTGIQSSSSSIGVNSGYTIVAGP